MIIGPFRFVADISDAVKVVDKYQSFGELTSSVHRLEFMRGGYDHLRATEGGLDPDKRLLCEIRADA